METTPDSDWRLQRRGVAAQGIEPPSSCLKQAGSTYRAQFDINFNDKRQPQQAAGAGYSACLASTGDRWRLTVSDRRQLDSRRCAACRPQIANRFRDAGQLDALSRVEWTWVPKLSRPMSVSALR